MMRIAMLRIIVTCTACFAAFGFWSELFAQRNLSQVPIPDPQLEQATFTLAEGFEVNLFAADPQIAKPIQMNFDERGRLWIVSSEIYPHIKPGQEADDKVLVLEDRDRDGVSDQTTVFARGLLIPTGVLPGDGGVYVANSTDLIHFSDTDGDGQADRWRIVLSGFGTEDTHHLLHTLRWGHDGCLYMNQSIYIHSHVETPYGVVRLNGGGIWRFHPRSLKAEILCRGFVNPWGHHFDYWGNNFATDGAYGEGINYVFPGAVFVTAPGAKRRVSGLNPGSPKHCGLEILSGRHLPEDWQGSMITNDFRAHRVCRFVVTEDGSGFSSRQMPELIKSTHVAFRPIDVKMGPDGAIYIADWYNPIIQHGEVDFRDERRDHTHGRIWRVTAKDRPLLPVIDLNELSIPALLDTLKQPEEWRRLHAKRVLASRDRDDVLTALASWLESFDVTDPDSTHPRLEALWLYQNLDETNATLLRQLLAATDPRARAAAVRVAASSPEANVASLINAVRDSHPRVRLEAVRGLAAVDSLEAVHAALGALDQSMDRFLDFALWQTMRDLQSTWLPAVQEGKTDLGGVDKLVYALRATDSPDAVKPLLSILLRKEVAPALVSSVIAAVATLGSPEDLQRVLDELVLDESVALPQRTSALRSLVEASRNYRKVPAGDLTGLVALAEGTDMPLQVAAVEAIGSWQVAAGRDAITALARNTDVDRADTRLAAIRALADLGGDSSAATLIDLTRVAEMTTQANALAALSRLDLTRAAENLVPWLRNENCVNDLDLPLAAFLQRKGGPAALIAALEGKDIPPEAAKIAYRIVQASPQSSADLLKAFERAGNLSQSGWQLTAELLQKLVQQVADKGDPQQGEEIYRRQQLQCMNCHAIGGAGGRVGPDLISIGASAPIDYLVESLIEPNKKVKENFHSTMVQTDDGRVLTGIPVRETEQELVLRDAQDREVTVAVAGIAARRDGRSLMPEGLVNPLTQEELVHLVSFLTQLGKKEFSIGQDRVVRRWQELVWTEASHRRLNRTSFDIVATDDPDLDWRAADSWVAGTMPLAALEKLVPHRGLDPTSFVRFELDVTSPGNVVLLFDDVKGLTLWIDGQPTEIQSRVEVALAKNTHAVTLAINRQQRSQPLSVQLGETSDHPAQVQLVSGK